MGFIKFCLIPHALGWEKNRGLTQTKIVMQRRVSNSTLLSHTNTECLPNNMTCTCSGVDDVGQGITPPSGVATPLQWRKETRRVCTSLLKCNYQLCCQVGMLVPNTWPAPWTAGWLFCNTSVSQHPSFVNHCQL